MAAPLRRSLGPALSSGRLLLCSRPPTMTTLPLSRLASTVVTALNSRSSSSGSGQRSFAVFRPTVARQRDESTSRFPLPSSSSSAEVSASTAGGAKRGGGGGDGGGLKAEWVPAEGASSAEPPKMDVVPKLQMTFTCTAPLPVVVETSTTVASAASSPSPSPSSSSEAVVEPAFAPCSHRSTHTFTRQAYTRGTVLIQCPACQNRHLIADHLGWFKELTAEGKGVDVEGILRARGEEVRRGSVGGGGGGTVEFY